MDNVHAVQASIQNTSFLVLCGGAGQRMGGVDKPLLDWHGKPMLEHVLASVPAPMPKLISANRNLANYADYGLVFTDTQAAAGDKALGGPLLGVLGGLMFATTQWLLISPGDTPDLPTNWWQTMLDAGDERSNIVAHDGSRQQHLHLLLRVCKATRDSLHDYLHSGRFEVYRWLETIALGQAMFDGPAGFKNVNRPTDLP